MAFYPCHTVEKVGGIGVVSLYARGYGKYIGVKHYIASAEPDNLSKQTICAATDLHTPLIRVGLTGLVKSHNHHGSAHLLYVARLLQKCGLALF